MFLDLAAEYAARLRAATLQVPATPDVPLTAAHGAALPEPVQRYLQRSGAIGKPPVRSFQIVYDAVMSQRPGQAGLPGPASAESLQPGQASRQRERPPATVLS